MQKSEKAAKLKKMNKPPNPISWKLCITNVLRGVFCGGEVLLRGVFWQAFFLFLSILMSCVFIDVASFAVEFGIEGCVFVFLLTCLFY